MTLSWYFHQCFLSLIVEEKAAVCHCVGFTLWKLFIKVSSCFSLQAVNYRLAAMPTACLSAGPPCPVSKDRLKTLQAGAVAPLCLVC